MEKNQHPDQRYVTALLNNDVLLVEEIYSRFSGKVKGMILNNNGNEDDAADIFQEALVDIYRKAVKGDFTLTCPFEALLIVICKNKWITALKKRQRSGVTFKEESVFNTGTDGFKEAEAVQRQNERRSLLERKFAELAESCRELLKLSWAGKPMEQVAALLNVSYAYARKRKSECMGKLTELVMASPDYKHLQS